MTTPNHPAGPQDPNAQRFREPTQGQPPAAPRGKSRAIKIGLVLAGLALVLVIAALVAGRVAFGTFLPGILIIAAIAAIAAVLTLRSHQSAARKAVVVTAIVLVVAAAVPASSKAVFPVYHHFFGKTSTEASPGGSAGPGRAGPSGGSGGGASRSGILVMSGDSWNKAEIGIIDPTTGKYTHVSSFAVKEPGDAEVMELSPDLTKLAVMKSAAYDPSNPTGSASRAGWIDGSGKFTAISPAPAPGADFPRSSPPTYSGPAFDAAGNFYYWSNQGDTHHLYKVAAGATSNPQEVTPTPKIQGTPLRNFDGTLHFGCAAIPGMWLGPDSRMAVTTNIGFSTSPTTPSQGEVIAKYPLTRTGDGCPWIDQTDHKNATIIFDLGIQNVDQPIASPDATKIAFYNSNSPGGLYVVNIQGDRKATRIAAKSDLNLGNLKLIRWN